MCEIPKKIDEIEVFPSNNASLKKKYTLKVINKYGSTVNSVKIG